MPPVLLGANAYKRQAAHLPEIKVKNRYAEKDPTKPDGGAVFLPRPGLVQRTTVGAGPIRGLFRQSGCFGGDFLVVSGSQLHRKPVVGASRSLGPVTGISLVEIAADGTNAFLAAGGLFLTDGETVGRVETPDDALVVSVATINSYFIFQVAESGRFYWVPPGEIEIDALDFATAERWPDKGVAVRTTVDEIWFLNEQSVEVWSSTGNAEAPFQRIEGRLFEWGCSARETAVNLDNTIFWVGERSQEGRVVLRGGAVPEIVSTNGISERLNAATALSAFTLALDGHEFYVLRIGGQGTFLYDVSTGLWSEWSSYGREQWRVQAAAAAPNGPLLLGDDETADLWVLDGEVGHDEGQPIVRQVTGLIPLMGQTASIDSLSLTASVGWSPDYDIEPVIGLRFSRDGFTFKDRGPRSLGKKGQYGKRVRWEPACGEIRPPGMVVELTDSDPVQTRISNCRMNEVA